jgi:hypothetical protein
MDHKTIKDGKGSVNRVSRRKEGMWDRSGEGREKELGGEK